MNASKSEFITNQGIWSGRRISRFGWPFAESHYNKVLQIPKPINLAQLEQIGYILGWLAPTIPNLAAVKARFQNLAVHIRRENNINDAKIRKTDSKLSIIRYWSEVHETIWEQLKNLINVISKKMADEI